MDFLLPAISTTDSSSPTIPYPINVLKHRKWQPFVRTNGYVTLAKHLMVKVVSDIVTARSLWELFSPNKTLFDLWDFRSQFYDSFRIEPYFLTIFDKYDDSVLGVLPLWLDDDEFKGKYSWYGGYWPESNTFFVKDLDVIPLLLMAAPKPLYLSCITPQQSYSYLETLPGFGFEDVMKYYLPLHHFSTVDDYLMRLKKKKRHNIRRDRKRILAQSPRTIINDFRYIDDLFRLNIDRFTVGENGHRMSESVFADPRHRSLFKRLLQGATSYKATMIATEINGRIEAVEIGFMYNGTFYSVSSGANITDYSVLGVYSNLLVIEYALQHNCEKIDFLEGDYNWKNSWDLESVRERKFIK